MGDVIADAFLDVNRTAARMNERRKKVSDDIVSGLKMIMDLGDTAKQNVTSGADILAKRLPEIAEKPVTVGGQSLSRKHHKKNKWRTRRQPTK